MSKQLNATVYVIDKDGKTHSFGPGDVVPKWARGEITNPDVWAEKDAADEVAQASPVPAAAALERPPMTGEGSGLDKWVAYAESLGIDIPEGATRADVITLVDEPK